MEKYYAARPVIENYKGWNIRTYTFECRYLGTIIDYIVDVRVGVESCLANTIEQARQYIDEKIKEGKTQREDI